MTLSARTVLFLLFYPVLLIGQSTHFADSIAQYNNTPDAFDRLTTLTQSKDLQAFPDTLAFVYHNLAYAAEDLNDYRGAVQANMRALHLREAVRVSDPETYGRSAFNLARNYAALHLRDSALYFFARVLNESPVHRQKTKSAYEIGRIYLREREFDLSRNFSLQALRFAEQGELDYEIQSSYVLLLDGFNAMMHDGGALHAADSIIHYAAFARQYFDTLSSTPDADALHHLSKLHFLESNAYKMRQDYVNALALLEEADALLRSAYGSAPRDRTYASELYNSKGILLRRLGQYSYALSSLQTALDMRLAQGNPIDIAVTHNNLGDVYADQEHYHDALKHFQASIDVLIGQERSGPDPEIPTVAHVRDHYALPDMFKYLGFAADGWRRYCIATGETTQCARAVSLYAVADSLVDIMRSGHLQESSKLLWREDAKNLYAGAIDAAVRAGHSALALYYADRSKAVLALDAVREHVIRDTPVRRLMDTRDSLLKEMMRPGSAEDAGDSWIVQTASLDRINRQIQDVLPYTANLVEGWSVQNPEHLQSLIGPGEAIIQYFTGADAMWAFVADSNGVRTVLLDREGILLALDGYRKVIEAFISRGVMYSGAEGADSLYLQLIAPLGPLPDRLIIVPDGAVGQIAFDGLRDAQGRFFIETKTIRYEMSLALAHTLAKFPPRESETIFGFAPMTINRCGHDALPYSRAELQGIATLAGGQYLYGDAATKRRLLQEGYRHSILHFASHAASSADNISSWIALGGDTSSCDLLYVRDLYTTHLPASLVVVSACEGAYGRYATGEGAMSIARGFLLAGAKSIVTSLWQVDDAATAEIMTTFYTYLGDGLPKSEALRKAKLDFLKAPSRKKVQLHPVFWSGFIVMGNDAPVQLAAPSRSRLRYMIFPGLIALIVIAYSIVRIKTRRRSSLGSKKYI